MTINLSAIISLFALAVAVTTYCSVNRRGKKSRNIQGFSLWQTLLRARANRGMVYVIINNYDHDHIIDRHKALSEAYAQCVARGELIDQLMKERMQSLNDYIVHQTKVDNKNTRWVSRDVRDVINSRHSKWEAIQNEIRVMIYPTELKG